MTADHTPDADDAQAPRHRAIRSFVLRAGRTTEAQSRALATLGPRWIVPFADRVPDWSAVFGREAPRVLEIGFGMGDATAKIAAARPEIDFIGVEVHPPGVGALLQRIDEARLSNLRIVQFDAVQVLRQMIAPRSLHGLHIYFPDPWPKKRHHKRRLIQPEFVQLATSRLQPGGYLHCATDWQPYAEHMLQVLRAEPGLVNTAADYAPRPDWRPVSKFERRGLKLGHGVWDLMFTAL
ncbi:tRNA (guanosine(46)-N7)-methyltransferase TrmB [Thiomonas bhubaneswarensis]|uniref:tRNA (guanine-N(7)-)-methyltransferase n=1 Tax=Thiomonas bhubaneswarensis TaxID=339866 RepID=A0A0K6I2F5_9BURK|nr:tRNA (guanosine(46)-N7)-methyltransferase TrmB [Thiomonas bhubaneswarensis]CUA97329.1 tRNA (guanine-N(7)-)-methyltransferase [Thiomonas bhubaneswarensis]